MPSTMLRQLPVRRVSIGAPVEHTPDITFMVSLPGHKQGVPRFHVQQAVHFLCSVNIACWLHNTPGHPADPRVCLAPLPRAA